MRSPFLALTAAALLLLAAPARADGEDDDPFDAPPGDVTDLPELPALPDLAPLAPLPSLGPAPSPSLVPSRPG